MILGGVSLFAALFVGMLLYRDNSFLGFGVFVFSFCFSGLEFFTRPQRPEISQMKASQACHHKARGA